MVTLSEHNANGGSRLRPSFLTIERFTYPDGLITNETAYWGCSPPGGTTGCAPGVVLSPVWTVTSGSLSARGNTGWTNSGVFRAVTRKSDYENVHVSMRLRINSLAPPSADTDGIHMMLRYVSEYSLYYASVNRRDGNVVIKKKCLGGPVNGGRYYAGPETKAPWAYGAWQNVAASVQTNTNGSVTISLYREGSVVTSWTDTGQPASPEGAKCDPITKGRVGIRADNADASFDDFGVIPL